MVDDLTGNDNSGKIEFLKNTPLFSGLSDEELGIIAVRMLSEEFRADELLFSIREESSVLYIIREGWVKLTGEDSRVTVASLGPGSLVGDADFFLGNPHSVNARTTGRVSVFSIDNFSMESIVSDNPEIGLSLGLALGSGIVQFKKLLLGRLRSVSFLEDLSQVERNAIAERLSPQKFLMDEIIYRSGEAPSGFYVVETGKVRLIGEGDDDYKELSEGETFGEMAVLSGKTHSETAQASTNCIIWRLSPVDFERVTTDYPSIRLSLSRNLEAPLSTADRLRAVEPLKRVPVFAELSEEDLADVASHLLVRHVPAGELVFRSGDTGDSMYIVESGRIEISAGTPEEPGELLARMVGGNFFGEMALLTGKSRSETAHAVSNTNLWVLYRKEFDKLLVKYPSVARTLSSALRERLSHQSSSVVSEPHLEKLAELAGLSRLQVDEIANLLDPKTIKRGSTIYSEGKAGKVMYFVERGHVELISSSTEGSERLTTGDFFGEMSLLTGKPRIETARARTQVDLWLLHKRDFDSLLFKYPNIAVALSQVLGGRIDGAVDRLKKTGRKPSGPTQRTAPRAREERRASSPPSPQHRPVAAESPTRAAPAARRAHPPSRRPTPERARAATRDVPPRRSDTSRPAASVSRSRAGAKTAPPRSPRPAERRDSSSTALVPTRQARPGASAVQKSRRVVKPRPVRRINGSVGQLAAWFAMRSAWAKLQILFLLLLLIWLCGIAAPASVIRALAANIQPTQMDANGHVRPVGIMENAAENGLVAALPFVGTATYTPSPTLTPTTTPTETPTLVPTPIPSSTPTLPPTDTPIPPTATPTTPATPTDTPSPTRAAPREPLPPTDTPTPEATPTPAVDFIVKSVRQLTACENMGKHHIYIRVVDANGMGIDGVPVRISWGPGENDGANAVTESKDGEMGHINFAMFKGTYNVQVMAGSSQVASGITPDIADHEICESTGEVGNTLYHRSYEVIFQRTF